MEDDVLVKIYKFGALSLCGPILVMNLAVAVAVWAILNTPRRDHRVTTMFQGNIAIADICIPISILLALLIPHEGKTAFRCAVEVGSRVATTLTSMCSILLIAVDRFLYILHSLHYYRYMTEFRARLLICLSWALGIIFGLLPVIIKSFYKHQQGPYCRFIDQDNVDIMFIAGGLGAPLMVATFVLYMLIYRRARSVSTFPNQMKIRSLIIVFLSSSCFFFTWGPFLISLVIYGSLCGGKVDRERAEMCRILEALMVAPLSLLGLFNSLINPLIFAWWFRPFTKAVLEIFSKKLNAHNISKTKCSPSVASLPS